jgi:hypothetical protein
MAPRRSSASSLAVLSLLAMFGSVGCGAAGTGVQQPGRGGPVSELLAIQQGATRIYQEALGEQFTEVVAGLDELEAAQRRLRASAERDGAPDDALHALADAVVALRWAATDRDSGAVVARAATRVIGATEGLVAFYRPTVPREALALEVLGRELAVDGMVADLSAAAGHARELQVAWEAVRARVLAQGGTRSVDAYDASVRAVQQAIDARDAPRLVNIANRGLQLAAEIHAVFGG